MLSTTPRGQRASIIALCASSPFHASRRPRSDPDLGGHLTGLSLIVFSLRHIAQCTPAVQSNRQTNTPPFNHVGVWRSFPSLALCDDELL